MHMTFNEFKLNSKVENDSNKCNWPSQMISKHEHTIETQKQKN